MQSAWKHTAHSPWATNLLHISYVHTAPLSRTGGTAARHCPRVLPEPRPLWLSWWGAVCVDHSARGGCPYQGHLPHHPPSAPVGPRGQVCPSMGSGWQALGSWNSAGVPQLGASCKPTQGTAPLPTLPGLQGPRGGRVMLGYGSLQVSLWQENSRRLTE